MANSLLKSDHNILLKLVIFVDMLKKILHLKIENIFSENCGNIIHRDINAANNILRAGIKVVWVRN